MRTQMFEWIKWYDSLNKVTGTMSRNWSTGLPLREIATELRRIAEEMESMAKGKDE